MSALQRLALLVPALLLAAAVQAAEPFNVQSAFINAQGGIYELDARVVFPLTDDVRSTLDSGDTIKLALQVVITKQRRYWLDKGQVDETLRRELSWDAVSRRYILKHVDSGEQDTFAELDEALVAAGVVRGWRIPVKHALAAGKDHEVSVRAGYRSTRLPKALRVLAFWSDGWSRKTEWKSWTLPR